MAALARSLVQFLAQAVGLGLMLALSLLSGAIIGNAYAARPMIGAALGAGCFLTAAVHRWRDRPDRGRLYGAALMDESPYHPLPVVVLVAFAGMVGAAALGGIAARHFGGDRQTILGAMIGAALGVALMLTRAMTFQPVERGEPDHGNVFGAARESTLAEMLKAGISTDYRGGIWCGVWQEWVATAWWQFWRAKLELQTHWLTYRGENSALMIAPPGSGKFTCSIAPTLLLNETDSIICFDPKGQACAVTASQRRRFGQEVVVFNPLDVLPGRLPRSAQINPLGELDIASPTFESDVKTMANVLVPIDPEEKNKFFPRSAQGLTAATMMFAREFEGPSASLPGIAQLLYETPGVRNAMFETMATKSRFAFVQGIGNRYL